jgi:2,3-diphosphopglycerate-independent phosphoglycerate mutase
MTRVLFVLIDGLGDTVALEQPVMQHVNQLVRQPSTLTGIMDPVSPGLACGSDTAHLAILGYDPRLHYHGRGAFESIGAGIHMMPGDIAFKSNFAVVNDQGIVEKRRADREFEDWGVGLCEDLCGRIQVDGVNVEIEVKYATEHRCGVKVHAEHIKLTGSISGTDPLKDQLPLRKSEPLEDTVEARITCKIVNRVSDYFREKLENHPMIIERKSKGMTYTNVVLLRGAGHFAETRSFEEKHGLKGFMIAPTAIIGGLGITLGLDRYVPQGATGDYRTNLFAKAECLVNLFKERKDYQFGFLHVKAVDDAGHDKDLQKKVEFLGKIDQMIGYILEKLGDEMNDIVFVLTGDHTTPVCLGDHSFEPVPFMITDLNLNSQLKFDDPVESFVEISCSSGMLGRFQGIHVMTLIKKYINCKEQLQFSN